VGHVARMGRREMHAGSGCGNPKDSDRVDDPVYRRRISASPAAVPQPLLSCANCPN
jgi:hypothetical protein